MPHLARLCALLAIAVAAPAVCAAPAAAAVPRFGHVFLVVGENTSYEQITPRHAPFLTQTIRPRGAWLTNDHAFRRSSSLGQYVAMVSGQFTRCEAHNDLPDHCHQRAPSVLAQLAATGRSWRDWEESMANACSPLDGGAAWARNIYSAHHNPALYFTGLQGGRFDEAIAPARPCRTNDLPMGSTGPDDTAAFDQALATGQVGDFNLVVPNDCEDGHDPCGSRDPVRQFDDFLAREVPKIEASPAFGGDGTVLVTWDEGADPPHDPGHVLLAALGPLVRPGAVDRSPHDHYGLERTLAEGFGVPALAHARSAAAITSITGQLTSWIGHHGAYAVLAIMALDALLPVGGELTMLYAGALAAGAIAGQHPILLGHQLSTGLESYVVLALAGTIGYLIGSLVGWGIGRWGERWLRVSSETLDRAEQWFHRHGRTAVFLGRLTPVVRSFISIPAGVFDTPLAPYTVLTLAGSAVWCFGFAGAGWALGSSYERVHHAFGYVDVVVVVAAVATLVALLALHRRQRARA